MLPDGNCAHARRENGWMNRPKALTSQTNILHIRFDTSFDLHHRHFIGFKFKYQFVPDQSMDHTITGETLRNFGIIQNNSLRLKPQNHAIMTEKCMLYYTGCPRKNAILPFSQCFPKQLKNIKMTSWLKKRISSR